MHVNLPPFHWSDCRRRRANHDLANPGKKQGLYKSSNGKHLPTWPHNGQQQRHRRRGVDLCSGCLFSLRLQAFRLRPFCAGTLLAFWFVRSCHYWPWPLGRLSCKWKRITFSCFLLSLAAGSSPFLWSCSSLAGARKFELRQIQKKSVPTCARSFLFCSPGSFVQSKTKKNQSSKRHSPPAPVAACLHPCLSKKLQFRHAWNAWCMKCVKSIMLMRGMREWKCMVFKCFFLQKPNFKHPALNKVRTQLKARKTRWHFEPNWLSKAGFKRPFCHWHVLKCIIAIQLPWSMVCMHVLQFMHVSNNKISWCCNLGNTDHTSLEKSTKKPTPKKTPNLVSLRKPFDSPD